MPIAPPVGAWPYDTLESVLVTARVRLNDAIVSIGGEVLTDTAPFSQPISNIAWRQVQLYLGNLGDTNFVSEVILTALPAVASLDPAAQCYINWTQFFDGVEYWPTPLLPQDLIAPLLIWERVTGANCEFDPGRMSLCEDGLPTRQKQGRNFLWEWRENALFFPGAQLSVDFRIRYIKNLGDFVTTGSGPDQVLWYNQPVPVPQIADGLSWFIAAEMSEPRGDINADSLRQKGEAALAKVFNRQVRREQRVTSRRQSYSGRGRQFHGSY